MNEVEARFRSWLHNEGRENSIMDHSRRESSLLDYPLYDHKVYNRRIEAHMDMECALDLMRMPTNDLIASNGQAYSTDCFREYQRRLELDK
jgi:hypothetical protein